MMHVFHTGELARLTADGRTVDAVIMLASTNGLSLMVEFDTILSGHVGAMPLLYKDDHFVSVVTGEPVILEPIKQKRGNA
jgi:hypothetical protein